MFQRQNYSVTYSSMEWLVVESAVESTVNILNFVALIYLLNRMRTTKMMHKNFRALLLNMCIALLLFNLTRFWKNFVLFISLFESPETENSLQASIGSFANVQCWIIRTIYDTTIYIIELSVLFMAVERMVATLAIQNYEQHESNIIALILVIPQWIISLIAAVTVVILDVNATTSRHDHSCSSIYYHPALMSGIFFGGVVGSISFSLVLFVLYQYNSKGYCKPGTRPLNTRYQMAENITTLRFLVPIVASFGALFASSFIIVLYIASNVRKNSHNIPTLVQEFFVYEQLYNLLGVTYTLLFVIFCISLHTPLRRTWKKDFGFLKRREHKYRPATCTEREVMRQLSCQKEANIHFAALQADWSQKGH